MKPVYDRNGICRYLVKYLTKAAFPDHILAVLYRKRLWGRSNTPSRKKSSGWSMLETVEIPKENDVRELTAVRPSPWKSAVRVSDRAWKITGALKGRWVTWVLTTQEKERQDSHELRKPPLQRVP